MLAGGPLARVLQRARIGLGVGTPVRRNRGGGARGGTIWYLEMKTWKPFAPPANPSSASSEDFTAGSDSFRSGTNSARHEPSRIGENAGRLRRGSEPHVRPARHPEARKRALACSLRCAGLGRVLRHRSPAQTELLLVGEPGESGRGSPVSLHQVTHGAEAGGRRLRAERIEAAGVAEGRRKTAGPQRAQAAPAADAGGLRYAPQQDQVALAAAAGVGPVLHRSARRAADWAACRPLRRIFAHHAS